jgi:hypothetical protein
MLQNTSGQEIDYNLFKMQFDANPELKNIVQSFNGQGIVLKTREKNQPTEFGKKPASNNSAAIRAANNVLKQPG